MPRKARRESDTGLYHIMIRGNNRSWIFQKEYNKKVMMRLMIKQEKEELIELYGWCIMDSHVHLIVRSSKDNLTKAMWNINLCFARIYNCRENTIGHVFESRFRSEPVEAEGYLLRVIRYVHMNPINAGIVSEPESYNWSSYMSYLSGKMKYKEIDIMTMFFNDNKESFKQYHHIEDNTEFLDTEEDIERKRIEKAQEIISDRCKRYNVTRMEDLRENINARDEILSELITESKLTITKIAKLAGLSYSLVQRANAKQKKTTH